MDHKAKLNLPIAIVKVRTSKFHHTSEVFLDTTRDKFLEKIIEENEAQYKKGFDQVYKKLDKNNNVSEAHYISHNTDLDDSTIDLIVLFQVKKIPMFPQEESERSEDLGDERTFENWLHGFVRVDRKDGFPYEYTLGIIGKEGRSRESNKRDFIDYIRMNNAIQYQKEFLQKSKTLNRYNYLTEAVYETADNEIEILIRFEIKELKCRVREKDNPSNLEILEDNHLVHLDKVA